MLMDGIKVWEVTNVSWEPHTREIVFNDEEEAVARKYCAKLALSGLIRVQGSTDKCRNRDASVFTMASVQECSIEDEPCFAAVQDLLSQSGIISKCNGQFLLNPDNIEFVVHLCNPTTSRVQRATLPLPDLTEFELDERLRLDECYPIVLKELKDKVVTPAQSRKRITVLQSMSGGKKPRI
jgi:hypothetical protein